MFQIIDSSEHDFYKKEIDLFVRDLKSHNPSLLEHFGQLNKATYVLAKENSNNIKGGALLLKRKISSLHSVIQDQIKDPDLVSQEVWVGTIYLHFPENLQGQSFESLCKVFYKHLYESLLAFGVNKKTSFLCLTLDPCEHLSTDLIGTWPYKVQVRHCESLDRLFHGVLSLASAQKRGLVA